MQKRVFDKIGFGRINWLTSPEGHNTGGWGMYLTASQISALAQLLLQKGNWKGEQLVPAWWIEEMGKMRVEIPGDEKKALTHYAYHIKAGKEIFAAEGAFGQYLICFRDFPVAIGITAGAREYLAADICLKYMKEAHEATGLNTICEVTSLRALETAVKYVDMLQIGARNMQNFELLKAVGRQKKPVLLKRGLANTLEEFVMSAEYIMAEGNENVILCERGIRTFETSMRNTLDLAGVVMLHKMTHLPVIVDPSHACGHAWMVPELAKAAVAAGADGLMIEVHNNPAKAKCDGAQSLTPDQFDELMQFINKEVEFFGKKMN